MRVHGLQTEPIFVVVGLTRTGSEVVCFWATSRPFRYTSLTDPWVEQVFLPNDVTHSQTIGILRPPHHSKTNNRKWKCLGNWQAGVYKATALSPTGQNSTQSTPGLIADHILLILTSHFETVIDWLQKHNRNSWLWCLYMCVPVLKTPYGLITKAKNIVFFIHVSPSSCVTHAPYGNITQDRGWEHVKRIFLSKSFGGKKCCKSTAGAFLFFNNSLRSLNYIHITES